MHKLQEGRVWIRHQEVSLCSRSQNASCNCNITANSYLNKFSFIGMEPTQKMLGPCLILKLTENSIQPRCQKNKSISESLTQQKHICTPAQQNETEVVPLLRWRGCSHLALPGAQYTRFPPITCMAWSTPLLAQVSIYMASLRPLWLLYNAIQKIQVRFTESHSPLIPV